MKVEKFRNNVFVDVNSLFKGNISFLKLMKNVIFGINFIILLYDCNNL